MSHGQSHDQYTIYYRPHNDIMRRSQRSQRSLAAAMKNAKATSKDPSFDEVVVINDNAQHGDEAEVAIYKRGHLIGGTHAPRFKKGERVQLHPGTDRWMMGDRYGVVTGFVKGKTRVKLDKSGRSFLFDADRLESVS